MADRRDHRPTPRGRAVSSHRPQSGATPAAHRPLPPLSPRQINSLEAFGYTFCDGRLQSTVDGKPFQYNVYADAAANQQRYHQIGKAVETYVYDTLVQLCELRPRFIPVDARPNEPTGFIFASDNFQTARYLMIIIHGNGSVRAGQWSRKLIINNGLAAGSQIDYIEEARQRGYGVIVTNTNMNHGESTGGSPGLIRVSASPEQHGCYVWKHYVQPNRQAAICIVAHSYGGAVVLAMAKEFTSDFQQRVFAIALTDSPMKTYTKSCSSTLLRILQKKTVNWVASDKPADTDLKTPRDYGHLRSAGHTLHEWTSATAFHGVFAFFEREQKKWEQGKR